MSVVGLPRICRQCSALRHWRDDHGCDEFDCNRGRDPVICEEQSREQWEEQECVSEDQRRYQEE